MIGQSFFAVVGTFFSITPAIVYLVAGYVNARNPNALSAGDLVAFTTLQSRIFFPIGSMLQISNDVQTSFALFDRIFEYLDMMKEGLLNLHRRGSRWLWRLQIWRCIQT